MRSDIASTHAPRHSSPDHLEDDVPRGRAARASGFGDLGVRISAPDRVPEAPQRASWMSALLGAGSVAAAGLLAGFYTVVDAAVERGAAQSWQVEQHVQHRALQAAATARDAEPRPLDGPRMTTASSRADAAPAIYSVLR